MRQLAAGFFLGLVVAPLVLAAAVYLYLVWWLERPPAIAPGSTLVIKLEGELSERPSVDSLSTFELWWLLHQATSDSRIARLLIQPRALVAGWAKLAEVRQAILQFRASGKPVLATLRTPGLKDYYVASAANRITLPPSDFVDVKGLRAELLYARTLLDKFGIAPEFEAVGRYKDGPDLFTRSTMSELTREVVNELLDARMNEFVQAVAAGRNRSREEVRAWVDQGPMLAPEALRHGFVDGLEFEDLGTPAQETRLEARDYLRTVARGERRVAIVALTGDILPPTWSWLLQEVMALESYGPILHALGQDPSIRGVILRIDSPGGDAVAADEIRHQVKQLAAKKPVVISLADIAASGGYAVSLAGAPVVCYPQTLTGSIGVFYGKFSLEKLYERSGIRKELLTRGRFAAIDSEARSLSPQEREKLRSSLEESYRQFVGEVAAARKMSFASVDRVAQGRIWLGEQAKQHGLVDELGGFDKAIALLRQKAGLTGSLRFELYPKISRWREWLGLLDRLRQAERYIRRLPVTSDSRVWWRAPAVPEQLR
ncbi:MAG: signal peptide peptidase SppA [Bryobacteraceae bacterium]|nr:signal peptide peptidase SppA [Bryobacteraceae bacterium]MDW8380260.1 signal peptide peptidase SppA [Bryobacterales bacterium]